MRRTTTSLALAAAALLLAGCGSQSGSDNASGSGKVSPSSSPASPAPTKGGCAADVQLKAADGGRTVCVTKGGEVRLTLKGTKSRPWKPVAVSGSALKGMNAGFVLQPGDATAAYHAVTAGTVKLTSSRPLCAQPTAPGQLSCKGIQEWTVTVTVQ